MSQPTAASALKLSRADFDEYCSDGDDNFTGESKAVSSSTITTDSTDDAQKSSGLIGARGYPFYMEHVVLNNAMQATVQVKLKPKGVLTPDATIHLYGVIMAHCNGNEMLLLVKDEEDDMKLHLDILQTSDGLISIPVPLMRSVFAVTVGSELILSVRLHVVCSSYDKAVSFKVDHLAFPNFGKRPKLTKKIDGPGMVAQVVVTAS
ncbi:hypothetical protein D1007_00177 [Hordeum vulgare]|nr:hypothetical protein D1007_00177 [Hordeum vulgare]